MMRIKYTNPEGSSGVSHVEDVWYQDEDGYLYVDMIASPRMKCKLEKSTGQSKLDDLWRRKATDISNYQTEYVEDE
ncbi:MAG: hypothetical protein FWE05_05925 [Defluviitaleaceae bacterium]|nr:hypothetical protein [Defluviitaleaceae bacterium]